jgi:hypothetical protein
MQQSLKMAWLKVLVIAAEILIVECFTGQVSAPRHGVACSKRERERAFISKHSSVGQRSNTSLQLQALTERQLQFWEDVDDGLKEIEEYYKDEKNMDIDRIFSFAKNAQKQTLPPPQGPGHEPSEEHVDGLTAQPFWAVASTLSQDEEKQCFPWAAALEQKSDIIINEFLSKLKRDEEAAAKKKRKQREEDNLFSGDSAWQNEVMGKGWSAFRLQRLGEWNVPNCQEFPNTYELLKSLNIPLAVRGVCFARQGADSGVAPHSDGRNFILTAHLGLKLPDGCWIKVGEEEKGWEEGKLTILDTSFQHSTGNPSPDDRHVLIIDFWHPEVTEAERAGLEFVYNLRNKFESGKVALRKPRSMMEQEGQGLAGLFSMFRGGDRGSK